MQHCEKSQLGTELGEVPFYGERRNNAGIAYFRKGIEVDKAKVEVIEKLPPTSVKGI